MYVWYGNDGFESAHRIPGWIDKGEDHQPQFRSPLFFWISCLNLIDLMARMLQSLRRVLGLNLPRSSPKYSRSINTNFSYFQRPFPFTSNLQRLGESRQLTYCYNSSGRSSRGPSEESQVDKTAEERGQNGSPPRIPDPRLHHRPRSARAVSSTQRSVDVLTN